MIVLLKVRLSLFSKIYNFFFQTNHISLVKQNTMKKLILLSLCLSLYLIGQAQVSKTGIEKPNRIEKPLNGLNPFDKLRPEFEFNDTLDISHFRRNVVKPTKTLVKSVQATVIKSVNITAGGLSSALTDTEKNTVTNLTITGTIDARDFKTMRDSLTVLAVLDISAVTIAAYTGTAGTYKTSSTVYPANEIPTNAFYNSSIGGKISLTSVTLPLSITSIGNYAFQNCNGLTGALNIPSLVTNIGYVAFYFCTKLTSVNLPASLTTIGGQAFNGCTITSITIPTAVSTIGNGAFTYCNNLTGITVQSGNHNFSDLDGVLFNKNQSTLIQYPNGKTASSYSIPTTVTFIGDYSFRHSNKLITITIPSSVTSIGIDPFSNCTKLTAINVESSNLYYSSLDGVLFNKNQSMLIQYLNGKSKVSYRIPETVTLIGNYAFYFCSNLTSITIPSYVSSIGSNAFYASGLTSVTIPASVATIGTYAFGYCTGLTSIYAYASTPVYLSSTSSVFYNVNKTTCTIYVPNGSKSLYQAAYQWEDFTNIFEFTTDVPDVNSENIKLYPNPVLDYFSLSGIEGKASVTISDLNGKTVLTKQITCNENIAVSTLLKGLYIVKLKTDDSVIERKMMKK